MILETAREFFDACETGSGWEVCQQWCYPDASFSAQADSLAGVTTVEAYCDWMRDLLIPLPDGKYDLKAMAVDEATNTVLAFAVFLGTHSVDGPLPATGNRVASDYVYAMTFEDGLIRQMTKIWNDGIALRELGWL